MVQLSFVLFSVAMWLQWSQEMAQRKHRNLGADVILALGKRWKLIFFPPYVNMRSATLL